MDNREIAGYFGTGYTTVSRAARRNRQRSRKTEGYNTIVGKLEARLLNENKGLGLYCLRLTHFLFLITLEPLCKSNQDRR